ncbi:MAG: nucleoid occlusion factor SlmA [Porticoccus sp.]|jgi:TetR/AcrR family transcriptional regulator|uniref:nucleoid occlusion factor SlmA n=1 Tax=Porticoccus TaxID=1123967 RepID=UPI0005667C32|nr:MULTISPECIES: nucleoid occlusion factor SlmA [Porticoccus]MAZ70151.1 nucleoid occlusion factor SlmA [Porticoccus sp.]MBG58430.1 nucleoid occlusion factor SlmA [Porticoccus sp.]|tara:strand:- start:5513 stop:6115 length:603 start_codon:yes stop_codon:yes gene_type:complete
MTTTAKTSRKQHILQALAGMLEAAPGGRITTAALAAEVGVSEAALYRHFPSKTRMYEGLIDFIEETLFTRMRTIIVEEPDAASRCYRILTLLLTFAERNPGITRLLTGDALTGETERLHKRIQQLFDRLETQLKQILREAEVSENLRPAITVTAAANLILALAEGKISQFVRSEFTRLPTANWQEQWSVAATVFFRDSTS